MSRDVLQRKRCYCITQRPETQESSSLFNFFICDAPVYLRACVRACARVCVCVGGCVGGWVRVCVRVRVCVLQMMCGVFGCRGRSWGVDGVG